MRRCRCFRRLPSRFSFNRDIRPILAENCFYCHGQDGAKREAGLRLDLADAARESKAIVPGDPAASLLLQRIRAQDPGDLMPPPGSNRHLSAEQKALLERWIQEGAPYETHWAFQAPRRPAAPAVAHRRWPRNAIDHFVLG